MRLRPFHIRALRLFVALGAILAAITAMPAAAWAGTSTMPFVRGVNGGLEGPASTGNAVGAQGIAADIRSLGATWTRENLNDSAWFDATLPYAQQAGITVLPVIPGWSDTSDVSGFASFVASMVKKYGPGTSANLTYFELWNEPFYAAYWNGNTPDPEQYARLYAAAVRAARAVNPQAKFLIAVDDAGNLPTVEGNASTWVDNMFTAVPDLGSLIDGVAFHPYGDDPLDGLASGSSYDDAAGNWSFARMDTARQQLLAHGVDVPFWLTEVGWSTNVFDQTTQAQNYRDLFTAVAQRPWIRALFPYNLRDSALSDPTNLLDGYGLESLLGTQKPAYSVVQSGFGTVGTSVSLQLGSTTIPSTGTATDTLTASIVDANGDPVTGANLAFSSSDPNQHFSSVTDHGDGTYSAVVTGSRTAGRATITVTDVSATPEASDHQTLITEPGTPVSIAAALSAPTVTADGTSTVTATATVRDADGNGVWGETVSFGSTDSGEQIGPVTDNGDGTYSATITSSTTAGATTITATDGSLSSSAGLTQTPGAPTSVSVSLASSSMPADGAATDVATARLTDAHGNPVPGQTVTFESTDLGEKIGPVTDNGDGTYTATVTASTWAGPVTIAALDGLLSATVNLVQQRGAPAWLWVTLSSPTVTADGTSTVTATAHVVDANWNAIPGQTVTFSASDSGDQIGPVADNGDGTYSATITASTKAGTDWIGAADGSLSNVATLIQAPGSPASVSLALSTTYVVAGASTPVTATATVRDANGNPVPGESVTFASTDTGEQLNAVTDNGDGTYSITLTPSKALGQAHITASDGSLSGSAALTQGHGLAAAVSTTLSSATVPADGSSTVVATAHVTDAEGNPVPGDPVAFYSNDHTETIGAVTDKGDGTYTATITASKWAGVVTVWAQDGGLAGTAQLTQAHLPASWLSLSLSSSSVRADGYATVQATARITDPNFNPVPGEHVTFSSSDSGEQIGPVTDNGDGTYTATITTSTQAGPVTITASDGSLSDTADLTQTPDVAQSVSVSLSATSIVADGTSTATATALVTDLGGHGMAGQAVSFSASDPGVRFSSVSDRGDGHYTVTLTSSKQAGWVKVVATDSSPATPISGHDGLAQLAGPAATIFVRSLAPVVADGASTETVYARVRDANGNGVSGQALAFTATDPGTRVGPVTDAGHGLYTATLTSSTAAHDVTLTATDSSVASVSTRRIYTQAPGPAASMTVSPSSPLVADGTATETLKVRIFDAHGNPVPGQPLTASVDDPSVQLGTVQDLGGGLYQVVVTSSKTARWVTVQFADGSVTPSVSGSRVIRQIAGAPATATFTALTKAALATGATPGNALEVKVADANGNGVAGQTLTFSSASSIQFGTVTDLGHGYYLVPVSSAGPLSNVAVTVTDPALPAPSSVKRVFQTLG